MLLESGKSNSMTLAYGKDFVLLYPIAEGRRSREDETSSEGGCELMFITTRTPNKQPTPMIAALAIRKGRPLMTRSLFAILHLPTLLHWYTNLQHVKLGVHIQTTATLILSSQSLEKHSLLVERINDR